MPTLQRTPEGYTIIPKQSTGVVTTKVIRATKKNEKELQNLRRLAQRSGLGNVVKKAQTPKLGLLQRIGRGVTSFETGDALYGSLYEEKPFLKTYATGMARGLGSMITGKDYQKLSKEGDKKTFKDILVAEGMRDRPGKIDPVDIAGLAGDILVDPTTFLGGFIGKGMMKSFKVGGGIGKKLPIFGKPIAKSEEVLADLFKPFNKVEKLGEIGKQYRSSYDKYVKGTRNTMNDFLQESAVRAKKAEKIVGKEVGIKIAVAKETAKTTGIKLLDDIMGELDSIQKSFTKEEIQRGILTRKLPNYIHHLITPEARTLLRARGTDFSGFIKPIRVRLGAAKERTIKKTISEINQESREKL